MENVRRGEIYIANLNPALGKEIKKTRPVLVISNDISNTYSELVTIIPTTSNIMKVYPFEVLISDEISGLEVESKLMCNQIRTIDKSRLIKRIGILNDYILNQIEKAICLHLDIKILQE